MPLYSPGNDPKYQHNAPPGAGDVGDDVVVSPDTLRADRLPTGQHRTPKWPVLHASSVPQITEESWQLTIDGLVDNQVTFSLSDFRSLPRVKVFADFHCVTTWSRLGNLWEGVAISYLLELAEVQSEARFAIASAYDGNWTTNVPLSALQDDDVLLADIHDGMPIDADHGGPVRLVVPRLFAWKSAKWVNRITLRATDQPGYWEQLGYHDVGDPWLGQRFRESENGDAAR